MSIIFPLLERMQRKEKTWLTMLDYTFFLAYFEMVSAYCFGSTCY